VVAGGGIAGICCAIAASRSGLRVALVHNRPVLGGNNSSEIRIALSDRSNFELYPNVGNIVKTLEYPEVTRKVKQGQASTDMWREWDKLKLDRVKAERNIDLFLSLHISSVQMERSAIESATAIEPRTGAELSFSAPLFVDCTGDANQRQILSERHQVKLELGNWILQQ